MSENQVQKTDREFINRLPEWMHTFVLKYKSNTASTFIFHGNIRDFLSQRTVDDEFKFVRIQDYFAEVLFGYKDHILCYDRSAGISFIENPNNKQDPYATRNDFIQSVIDRNGLTASNYKEREKKLFNRSLTNSFEQLEKYFYKKLEQDERIVLIFDFAETVIPFTSGTSASEDDRFSLVTIKKWAYNPLFIRKDIIIILLAENLHELNQTLVKCPNVIKVQVPIPNEDIRLNFLKYRQRQGHVRLENGLTVETMAKVTSGLNLVNINQIIAESYRSKKNISMEYLRMKKKELIESESIGMLEIVDSEHNLDMVSGHKFVKSQFMKAAQNIKAGRLDVLPMGYLISGPVGTGKTFLVTCFTGEIGIPMVKMLNFRSKYVGVTEGNIEKILNILKAMAPVAVMIDEADAVLGDRNQSGDSGTSNRVFAQIASFMGNTDYRGKIIWFLITCRPDLLPIDIKRQGRCEEHHSLFYPDTPKEREDLFYTLIRKLNIKTDLKYNDEYIRKQKYTYSGADLEAILVRAKFNAASEGEDVVSERHFVEAISNFIPAVYPYEVELQNLVSVLECTHKDMVPARYNAMTKQKIAENIMQIKAVLGER